MCPEVLMRKSHYIFVNKIKHLLGTNGGKSNKYNIIGVINGYKMYKYSYFWFLVILQYLVGNIMYWSHDHSKCASEIV